MNLKFIFGFIPKSFKIRDFFFECGNIAKREIRLIMKPERAAVFLLKNKEKISDEMLPPDIFFSFGFVF